MANDDLPVMDRLTGQLYHLPAIIGNLGISVANAQKALNADYIHNIEKIMDLIKRTLGNDAVANSEGAAVVRDLLKQLAPSRYQFTETTLEFSADLSERKSKHLQAALGAGFAGVTISAGYARAFGYDYRAAARVRAILHAIPADPSMMDTLLNRAGQINLEQLPPKYQTEADAFNGLAKIADAVSGSDEKVKRVGEDEIVKPENL
jgi:hypothetical protein